MTMHVRQLYENVDHIIASTQAAHSRRLRPLDLLIHMACLISGQATDSGEAADRDTCASIDKISLGRSSSNGLATQNLLADTQRVCFKLSTIENPESANVRAGLQQFRQSALLAQSACRNRLDPHASEATL
ncbi:TPA: hypothetical protein ACH3X1_003085 [Trebouxia sp. C0004]